MLRRLGIRAKVLAVLAVPMIVLLVAGAYISYSAIQDLRYARATQTVVRTLDALSPLTAAFQQERILSLTGATPEDVAAARQRTDSALADARRVTAELDLGEFPDTVVRDFQDQQNAYGTALPQLRDRVDKAAQRVIVKNGFQDILDGQTRVMEGVANSLRDRDLAEYISANRELQLLSDALVNEYVTGIELKNVVADSPALARSFQSQTTATELARERARYQVDALEIEGLGVSTGDPTSTLLSMRALFTQGSVGAIATVDLNEWTTQTTNQMTMIGTVNDGVLKGADEVAADGVTTARDRALVTVALALLALVVSFFFAVTVARSIVVPLRRLTSAAADVREQLPRLVEQVATPGEGPEIMLAPIPVRSQDEIGRLAQAFNAVNATTVQVAQEQAALRGSIAEMFVNVARRDQVLLNRQLSFIDSLERAEEDPGTLANLFRLDHLATRMRRNAESLLVLAGIDSGRRLRDAMPLSDVIRTASSEIEQYDRVELDLQVDPHMLGFNALSAAHLLAELLENATVFSEPETPVVVSTGVSGASVVVRIADQGLGMTDAEIEAANSKIISVSAGDALGAQRLGLFVVGRLAQRLGAEVTLRKRVGGTGTEAYVQFPSTLFSANEVGSYGALPPSAAPVSSSALPEIEIPEVRAVDLAELTDGETSLGLPRRRRGDDTGAAPVAQPAASASDDDAPIPVPMLNAPTGLPARSRKTFDEDNIVLPVAPEARLSPELSVDTGEWAPAVAAAPLQSGLPTRSRAATPAWASEPDPVEETRPAVPADPAARAGLFSGFRSGKEAPVPPPSALSESAPVPHGEQSANGFVVPSLAPEDAPAASAATAEAAGDSGWPVPSWRDGGHGLPSRGTASAEPAAEPTEQWTAPQTDSWTAPATDDTPWSPTQAEEQWAAPAAEQAPAASWEAPQEDAPSWDAPQEDAPSWDAPQEDAPSWDAPQESAPSWDAPQAPAASWETPQENAPTWEAPQAPAASWDEQPAGAEHDTTPAWSSDEETAPWAAEHEQAAEPELTEAHEPEPTFTSYSGYSGWAGSSDRPALQYTAPYVPFERSLDEARAWHTGALPVVPEPVRPAEPAWSAPAAQEAGYDVEPEPEVEEEVAAPWAPVAATPALEPAEPAQSAWQAPTWQDQQAPAAPAPEPAPAPAPVAEQWRPATPAWARSAAADQPTQAFAPVVDAAPVASAPVAPALAAPAPTAVPVSGPAFGDVVGAADDKPKRRWGNFFSRRKEDDAVDDAPAAAAPAPVRTSAWGPDGASSAAPAAQPAPAAGWQAAPAWAAPAAPQAATPTVQEARPTPSWSPPEWAGRQPAPASTVPHPSVPPSAAPRVGTLDDEVAAMLALRSDIQEQALSELSQLSAYRPSAVGASGSERLTKRVPSAVPAAPAPVEERPVQRDAEQLRSRLSSFQTGTSRGRRAAHGPQDGDHS
ncbi:integral membrane sensor signal transduction histidine kinase [Cellulomonas flavigena DSM 20109]|uniref:histidine kinase n=1 Tax=Cellulomonas flavigena (strain ATCC 482 / DSM 20109 / BCRC 11376 / JCM 18109 / NBRC 3775 / NCIMB 8073 / NRS 134) TaxID=446466 RepID=D5ULV1_CELFN|nr:ATP-binding protein [Cellulomonas flavigena]ADG76057.1 integral membrane sensor signal transduction histidine kinase [Cellulomonas flavigena DSM 20109]